MENMLELFRMIYTLSTYTFWLFLFCYFGNQVTTRFTDIGETIYQCDWYSYPMEMLNEMPLVISIMQKPIYLRAFGSLQCTREIFQKVIS